MPNYNARSTGDYSKIWMNTGKCVFCDLKDKYIIKEINNVVLTVNLFPYIDGHLLIIPRRHFESFEETTDDEMLAIKQLADYGKKLLKDKLNIEYVWFIFRMNSGFNAQKTVAHVHAHLIPFSNKLFKWEYQNINIPVDELARKLRS